MRKPLFRYTQTEREDILSTLRQSLEGRPEIVFAYAHGSFLENRPFHDVDLAVYLNPDEIDERNMSWFALDLASDLEESLRTHGQCPPTHGRKGKLAGGRGQGHQTQPHPPLDMRALNQAPLGFRYRVCRGRLLFSHDEALHTRWVERTVCRYLDLRPLQHRALKEAMTD